MFGEPRGWHGLTEMTVRSHDEAQLGLEVEPGSGSEGRLLRAGRVRLAAWPANRRAGHDDGTCPAVVAGGQVPPVRRQRLRSRPEDPAGVGRVILRGIEVDIVRHGEGQQQGDPLSGYEEVLDGGAELVVGEPGGETVAHLGP